jgi:hypothetical protein
VEDTTADVTTTEFQSIAVITESGWAVLDLETSLLCADSGDTINPA